MHNVPETPSCGNSHRWVFDGRSEHPVKGCSRPNQLRCASCGVVRAVRCRSPRSRCAECSARYQRQVRRVARSGIVLLPGREYMLTLTAPGAEPHRMPNGEWCPCTTPSNKVDDKISAARWNGECVHRWNRLRQDIERALGVRFQYFKAVEVQDRGLLHLHVLVRFDQPCKVSLKRLRELCVAHNFGHAVRLDPISDERAAWYVSKYVTKCADVRELVPYCHRKSGELGPGRWRTWTSSRRWGESIGSIRAAQRAWVEEQQQRAAGGGAGGQGTESPAPATPGADAVGAFNPKSLRYTDGAFDVPLVGTVGGAM